MNERTLWAIQERLDIMDLVDLGVFGGGDPATEAASFAAGRYAIGVALAAAEDAYYQAYNVAFAAAEDALADPENDDYDRTDVASEAASEAVDVL